MEKKEKRERERERERNLRGKHLSAVGLYTNSYSLLMSPNVILLLLIKRRQL